MQVYDAKIKKEQANITLRLMILGKASITQAG